MSCDSKSYNALRHISQTILQQMVEINKYVVDVSGNKELPQEEKNKLLHFANYHLLVLSILMNDGKFVALKEFPDAAGIIKWSEAMYQGGLDNNQFTPCACDQCKSPEIEVELVETKA